MQAGSRFLEKDIHSFFKGGTNHSSPSSALEATGPGAKVSITIPTPHNAKFFSGPYTFTAHSLQAVV